MNTYNKIDDTTIEIITPQPDKVERVNLDWLRMEKESLVKQKELINEKLEDINTKISEARRLGTKTLEEVQQAIVVDNESIQIEEKLI